MKSKETVERVSFAAYLETRHVQHHKSLSHNTRETRVLRYNTFGKWLKNLTDQTSRVTQYRIRHNNSYT